MKGRTRHRGDNYSPVIYSSLWHVEVQHFDSLEIISWICELFDSKVTQRLKFSDHKVVGFVSQM